MASADFLQLVVTALRFECVYSFASARPPRVSSITFASYICCIYAPEFGQYRTSFCFGNSSLPSTPCMQFLFVRPRFCPRVSILPASDFLQIPPHDGHPCLRLTVPTAKSVADFHRQVIAHAERTKEPVNCCFLRFTGMRHYSLRASSVFPFLPTSQAERPDRERS